VQSFTACMPLLMEPAHSDKGEDDRVLLSSVIDTASVPCVPTPPVNGTKLYCLVIAIQGCNNLHRIITHFTATP